jgi:hypothetical protein
MKKFLLIAPLALFFTGCTSTGGISPTADTDLQNALLTVANVVQQLNTGVQTIGPSVSTILSMTDNQGDATAVNNVIAKSATGETALETLLANVSTAVQNASTPAAQQAAVSAAVSPAAVAAIVSPSTAPAATSGAAAAN